MDTIVKAYIMYKQLNPESPEPLWTPVRQLCDICLSLQAAAGRKLTNIEHASERLPKKRDCVYHTT